MLRVACAALLCGCVAITAHHLNAQVNKDATSTVDDPLRIPVISENVEDDAFADSGGVHIDPGFCWRWPKACEWVKWHERCHYLYFHRASASRCDGSFDGENNADAYAVANATADQTREAIKWFRSAVKNGRREIGNHMPISDRANRIEALLEAKLRAEPNPATALAAEGNGCTKEDYAGVPRGAKLLQCGHVTAEMPHRKRR